MPLRSIIPAARGKNRWISREAASTIASPAGKSNFRREIMGLALSVPQLLIILVIVALIFGTKRLKDIGGDLGGALKSFRKAMSTSDTQPEPAVAVEPKRLTQDDKK
jgi:sec-independent protein translocase protein TatA